MKRTKELPRHLTPQELYNPTIDLATDAVAYARQSTAKQVVKNVESSRSQTVLLLKYMKDELGYREDGTTGSVRLFVENQVIEDGNTVIKSASGAWPIDKRPGLKTIIDLIDEGRIKLVVADDVSRLFRDEDRIDSNQFIKSCKDSGCYVHIVLSRKTFNFNNYTDAETFRMLVQHAAQFLQNLRDQTLRRRSQAAERGLWAGLGALSMAYTIEKDRTKPSYGKFKPVEKNAEIWKGMYNRIVDLNFNIDALVKELKDLPYIFPNFETGVHVGTRSAKKVPGGYMLSVKAIRDGLCNPEHIGIFQRDGNYIEKNHPAIIDEETFWTVYDHFRNVRPDGTPTGRNRTVRYERTENTRPALLKKVLSSDVPGAGFYYKAVDGVFYYECSVIGSLTRTTVASFRAEEFEHEIVSLLLAHVKNANLNEIKDATTRQQEDRKKRLIAIGRRLETIAEDQESILEEIIQEKRKLKKAGVETNHTLELWQKKLEKSVAQNNALIEERELLEDKYEEVGTLEAELEILEEIWPYKPIGLKRELLEGIINTVRIEFKSPRCFKVLVKWAYEEWGTESAHLLKTRANNHKWSTEEVETLRAMSLRRATREELWREFHARTHGAIRHQLEVMGLPAYDCKRSESSWTYDDVLFLRGVGVDAFSLAVNPTPYKLTGWWSQRVSVIRNGELLKKVKMLMTKLKAA